MCYSAQLIQQYEEYVDLNGADIDIEAFARLYGFRCLDDRIKIPKVVEVAFQGKGSPQESNIQAALEQYQAQQATKLEQELFKQRTRLVDAERTLLVKTTKAATESQRIATSKMAWAQSKLADLRRTELTPQDARIYPGFYAPVIVMESGRKVVKPMRYQCRPEGKAASFDAKFPGTYNARRDNLEGFWREQFGYSHGILAISAFYEHVELKKADGEPEKVILEFNPRPQQVMLVACLWSRWSAPGEEDLLSFAAITDEPPAEVAAAGHDRCVIPIKPEHVDAWLSPDRYTIQDLYDILDDRERPYYENRKAA
ncbi:SOS response-associated peptidase family protein [Curvibacter sp. AEP1-3]|uniref:SOS response-associated peptidase family protein n=1 Tax=Curvibacter sp. AEP1-3 TaxID=1844971 RepID=UPI000B3C7295|nr:SOS response-associated peptidase family protein [Curvibacter sp. AEP1-3]